MHRHLLAALLLLLAITATPAQNRRRAAETPAAETPAPAAPAEPLRTAGDRPVDIQHIRLDLTVDLPKKTVDAAATLTLKALRPLASFALDAVDFEVKKVTLANGDNALILIELNGGAAGAPNFSWTAALTLDLIKSNKN